MVGQFRWGSLWCPSLKQSGELDEFPIDVILLKQICRLSLSERHTRTRHDIRWKLHKVVCVLTYSRWDRQLGIKLPVVGFIARLKPGVERIAHPIHDDDKPATGGRSARSGESMCEMVTKFKLSDIIRHARRRDEWKVMSDKVIRGEIGRWTISKSYM